MDKEAGKRSIDIEVPARMLEYEAETNLANVKRWITINFSKRR